mgnify:CR=1 FL=1
MEYDYEWFKKSVFSLTRIDLNVYNEKQMKRRIDTLIGDIIYPLVIGFKIFNFNLRTVITRRTGFL